LSDARPLLTLDQACIESGRSTTGPWNATGGERLVALVGYFSPLLRLLRGEARLARGAVRVAGDDATGVLRSGRVALASQEAPSVTWTAERYLEESARLSLLGRQPARARVQAVLASLDLAEVSKVRLRELGTRERRLVSLARAVLGNPDVICAEAPLAELDGASEARVADALERILAERRLIVSFPTAPLGGRAGELFERADLTITVRDGALVTPITSAAGSTFG